jgi:hypothetical protein
VEEVEEEEHPEEIAEVQVGEQAGVEEAEEVVFLLEVVEEEEEEPQHAFLLRTFQKKLRPLKLPLSLMSLWCLNA